MVGLGVFVIVKLLAAGVGQVGLITQGYWYLYGPKTLLLVISGALIALDVGRAHGRTLSDYGVRRGQAGTGRLTLLGIGIGILIGVLGSLAGFVLPGEGMGPLMGRFPPGFVHVVLGVWLWSSLTEEVFVRGVVQTWMDRHVDRGIRFGGLFMSWPVLTSGLLFGALHASILIAGCDLPTTLQICTMTAAGGLLCAFLRERTGSLFPAIVCHVFLNIGGMIGGIIGFVLTSNGAAVR
jgi:membrane protease YdiL (CAAX protease family)